MLFRTLAPLAGFTDSAASISVESPQLAPTNLRKCPANVGMFLSPTYQCHPSPRRARFLAVDVTVLSPPSLRAGAATSQHQDAEKKKFAACQWLQQLYQP
jgi:hypothetical protein